VKEEIDIICDCGDMRMIDEGGEEIIKRILKKCGLEA